MGEVLFVSLALGQLMLTLVLWVVMLTNNHRNKVMQDRITALSKLQLDSIIRVARLSSKVSL